MGGGPWYSDPDNPQRSRVNSGQMWQNDPNSMFLVAPAGTRFQVPKTSGGAFQNAWNTLGPGQFGNRPTMSAYLQYIRAGAGGSPTGPGANPSPFPPSGYPTGGSRGGGGGGGGTPLFNQEQIDAIARLFGGQPQQMTFNQFQGPAARPFDSSMYDKLDADVKGAAAKDKAASGAAYDQLANTLQSTYKNAYTNAPTTATPQVQDSMRNLLAAQGAQGGEASEAINAENAYSQNSDGAFANLLAVLGAGADQSQASRMAQVGMDKNTSGQNIDATASGYGAGIGMARTRAQQDYQRMLDDRAYQEAMLNWQGQQQTNQANVGINNDWRQMRLDPIMQLILGAAPGLNFEALFGG